MCSSDLLLIAVNAAGAFAALGHWPASSLPLLVPILLGGAVGARAGQWLAPHLSEGRLRQGFAALLLGSALLTGAEACRRQGLGPGSLQPSHAAQTDQPQSSPHSRS
mgnify:CR=1 FL=1